MPEHHIHDSAAGGTVAPDGVPHCRRAADRFLVREVTASDYEKLAVLLHAVWGLKSDNTWWRWKFAYNRGVYSGPVVEDASGAIIAFTGLLVQKVLFNGREITAEWIIDLMGHPSQKGKAYPLVLSELKKVPYRSFTGGFHNDDGGRITKAGLRRTGSYKLSAHVPRYCLFLDPSIALKDRLSRPLRAIVSAAYRVVFGLHAAGRQGVISQVTTIGGEFDALWAATHGRYQYIQYRGSDYLRWRFMEMPGRKHQVWAAKAGGTIEGYMVTTLVKDRRGFHGSIVDWLMPRERTDVFHALLRKALAFFIENRVWSVDIHCMSHERQWVEILRRHLFIRRKGRVFSIWVRDEVLHGQPITETMLFITPGDSDFPGADEGKDEHTKSAGNGR